MPYSLVLNLTPTSPIYPNFLQGRHFHALFLNLVQAVDPELSAHLHESAAHKPFSLSPLQIQSPRKLPLQWQYKDLIPPGTPCWWRVSLLDDGLFKRLTQLWLNLNPERPWHLGPADLKITSILGTPQPQQPWSNACLYEQLYEQASEDNKILAFSFATPMAFRQGKYDTAFPSPELVFNSLRSRWNKYSSVPIESLNLEAIFPSFFEVHSEMVNDGRTKFIGCVGSLTYRIFGSLDAQEIRNFNALADFALYAGVGRKTTMGMGMVRRLETGAKSA
ncbi:CRISPR-associated endoribonuclease Cas6 [Spirulina subsalsa FACHB-351]|uniref:CRISPR-associated endoribonuclease Cas6 n=1 Tax=Spirulina subsalsa FACHB-351 TaxID=234711 RepID=A0ABT3L4Q3_9CYAN|nr:CRISPR-associated endoribonuclease Cas6 [Spirulina subsalsa]MCW6036479.1 CRISPR-associated endoribonuclease Cas6 [Spirulina subsalsa FACHB-351]